MIATAIQQLVNAVGSDNVLTSNADKISYSYGGTYVSHLPEVVVFPRSAEHVQQLLNIARRHRLPVFTRGSGTGLSGGSIPLGGIALATLRLLPLPPPGR